MLENKGKGSTKWNLVRRLLRWKLLITVTVIFRILSIRKFSYSKMRKYLPEMLRYWKWEIHVMLILYLGRNHRHGGAGSLDARGCSGLFCGDYS